MLIFLNFFAKFWDRASSSLWYSRMRSRGTNRVWRHRRGSSMHKRSHGIGLGFGVSSDVNKQGNATSFSFYHQNQRRGSYVNVDAASKTTGRFGLFVKREQDPSGLSETRPLSSFRGGNLAVSRHIEKLRTPLRRKRRDFIKSRISRSKDIQPLKGYCNRIIRGHRSYQKIFI